MRTHWRALPFLLPALAAILVGALPSPDTQPSDPQLPSLQESLSRRDGDHAHGHGHGHNAQPVTVLNETEVLLYHSPTPESYWTIDMDGVHPDEKRYPALMGLHVVFMSAAFFGALPAGESPDLSDTLGTCT
jgi:hypothetical protein